MHSRFKPYLLLTTYYLLVAPFVARAAGDLGLTETATEAGFKTGAQALSVSAFGGQLVGYLLAFVGVIFFALTLYGGIMWMTARGNEETVKKAQEIIKSAVLGLAIVFLSYAVTNFVVKALVATQTPSP